jgi:hypothetical protein
VLSLISKVIVGNEAFRMELLYLGDHLIQDIRSNAANHRASL